MVDVGEDLVEKGEDEGEVRSRQVFRRERERREQGRNSETDLDQRRREVGGVKRDVDLSLCCDGAVRVPGEGDVARGSVEG